MKKIMVACIHAVMMVLVSASVFAGNWNQGSQYTNQWDGEHDRDWVGMYEDCDGGIQLGNNPHSILNKKNRGNNTHKILAYHMQFWDWW